ncbi:MAG: 50S ribosomal protein L18 [Verrucomicrobiota bacterium]
MVKKSRKTQRKIRHERIRKKIFGTPQVPRMCVSCSNRNIDIQFIDDVNAVTLAAASSREGELREQVSGSRPKVEDSRIIAQKAVERALAKDIKKAVFDRGGFKYHGRVKAMADAAREGGIEV